MLVTSRFATLVGSEGSEETKILSAQMLAIPMLKQSTPGDVTMLLEMLLKNGATFGPKLTCEMLRIVDILLERDSVAIAGFRKRLLKYIWSVLRASHPTTKNYAYLSVSRFIAVFDTPSKIILQVYRSLLCDTSESETVHAAMDVLLPTLNKSLSDEELGVALDQTVEVIQDDQQMTNLWRLITRHPQVYVSHKSAIMPHMLRSLASLGQLPNASIESRDLALALAQLIVDWGGILSCDQASDASNAGLDQNGIDTVLNILLNILVFSAKGRRDQSQQHIRNQIMSLIKSIVSSKKKCKLDHFHFQHALEPVGTTRKNRNDEDETKSSKSTRKESSDLTSGYNADVLALCAEIVLILLCYDPKNAFIEMSICHLLNQYTLDIASLENRKLEQILRDALVHLFSDGHASNETIAHIVVILERILRESSCVDQGRSAFFALSVIEKIWETNHDFVEPLLGSLAMFTEEKAKEHVREAKGRQITNASSMQQMSENGHRHQLSATPTMDIFVETCGLGLNPPCQAINGVFKNQKVIENQTLSVSLNSLIISMRIVGSSGSLFTSISGTRNLFMEMISTVLESSNSLPVVIQGTQEKFCVSVLFLCF